jgi:hypothetical protein
MPEPSPWSACHRPIVLPGFGFSTPRHPHDSADLQKPLDFESRRHGRAMPRRFAPALWAAGLHPEPPDHARDDKEI